MERAARTRLTVAVVAVILAVPLVTLALSGGDGESDSTAPGLRIERSGSELIVYVEPEDNAADRAAGARTVMLRCVDKAGRLVTQHEEAWPLGGSDGIAAGPHAHMALDPVSLGSVAGCRFEGTAPLLEGPVR